ncbi:hypothetical protein HMN09_00714100 [Mycena chlorophos]|uniref:Uncharacterized protein n=1 Tax=Mycena chlorophos TaxID=658473 RepID=A0A8H6T1I1_MYCCL|nr:hypothetical protein HMN09_00714100 [Mycena chlorophos]
MPLPEPRPPRNDDPRPPLNSRIISSVRRTLSTAKRRDPIPPMANENKSFPRFRYDSVAPPTVEQIAYGLHLSRTPHLRPTPKDGSLVSRPVPHPQPTPKPKQPTPNTPVPPLRSSMKKPGLAGSSSSTTDVTSTAPSTPHSSERSSASLRVRMARFIPHRGPGPHPPPPSTPSSARSSVSKQKAVRFSTNPVDEDERR